MKRIFIILTVLIPLTFAIADHPFFPDKAAKGTYSDSSGTFKANYILTKKVNGTRTSSEVDQFGNATGERNLVKWTKDGVFTDGAMSLPSIEKIEKTNGSEIKWHAGGVTCTGKLVDKDTFVVKQLTGGSQISACVYKRNQGLVGMIVSGVVIKRISHEFIDESKPQDDFANAAELVAQK